MQNRASLTVGLLIIASLGWIFDVFEGQVLLSSEKQMLADLLASDSSEGTRDFYKYVALASFLAGGAVGGVFFGALADTKRGRDDTRFPRITSRGAKCARACRNHHLRLHA